WEKMQQLNLNAAFRLCKAVLPVMYRQKSGRVVMIAAQSGLRGT
ncbi:MAG: SDR family oxidoreductase, partial [Calditrichaeota bacterium]|nr:SDR family oxidoreductase [Calditrichota bacterium]